MRVRPPAGSRDSVRGDRRRSAAPAARRGLPELREAGRRDFGPRQHITLHHRGAGLFGKLELPAFLDAFEDGLDALLGEGRHHRVQQREARAGFHQPRDPLRVELDDVRLQRPDPLDVGIVRRRSRRRRCGSRAPAAPARKRASASLDADFCSVTSQTMRRGSMPASCSTSRMSRSAARRRRARRTPTGRN